MQASLFLFIFLFLFIITKKILPKLMRATDVFTFLFF